MIEEKFTLEQLRNKFGWSREEAAVHFGVSAEMIKKYESYEEYPDISIIKNIVKTTGVNYDNIIFLPLRYGKTVNKKWRII